MSGLTVFLCGEKLEQVPTFDYLGVRWQENCKWDAHFEKVALSATRVAGLISAMLHRTGPPPSIIRQLCHALIRTKILYGMPVWRPSNSRQWSRLDTILAEPMRRCLGLPKSTHIPSLLVEMNTLWTERQFEVLTVVTCHRALSQPQKHQSHVVVQSQLDWNWPFEHQQPASHIARRVCVALKAPAALERKQPELPARKMLVSNALALQRIAWRNAGRGRSLHNLVPIGPRLPQYLVSDPRPVAILRARLRFDRARLAESRKRRGEQLDSTLCRRCHEEDSLEHLLYDCTRHAAPRNIAMRLARQVNLPTTRPLFGLWMLGLFDHLDKELVQDALEISAEFLLAISTDRKL